MMRDAQRLIKEQWPIWSKGVTPIGCFNRKNDNPVDPAVLRAWRDKFEGSIAVCDDGGVVIIPKEKVTSQFLHQLDFIELQEDIWFYCINTKKWDTYETVCLKKYKSAGLLPAELEAPFEEFQRLMNAEK